MKIDNLQNHTNENSITKIAYLFLILSLPVLLLGLFNPINAVKHFTIFSSLSLLIGGIIIIKFKKSIVKPEIAALTSWYIACLLLLYPTIWFVIGLRSTFPFDFMLLYMKLNPFHTLIIISPIVLILGLLFKTIIDLNNLADCPELDRRLYDFFHTPQFGIIASRFLFLFSLFEYGRNFLKINIRNFWNYKTGLIISAILSSWFIYAFTNPNRDTIDTIKQKASLAAKYEYGDNYKYIVVNTEITEKYGYANIYAYNDKIIKSVNVSWINSK